MKLLVNMVSAKNITREVIEVATTEAFPNNKDVLRAIRSLSKVKKGTIPIQCMCRVRRVSKKESFTIDTNFYPVDITVIEALAL